MAREHSSRNRGLDSVVQSPREEGRFGYMFRRLPSFSPSDGLLEGLAANMRQPETEVTDNGGIPAGYTYLGQLLDHDITFDPTSELDRLNDPAALINFRNPRFDLDSLYGSGPADSPFLYEWSDRRFRGVKLLDGRNPAQNEDGTEFFDRQDLPRNRQGRATIGDPRNDENIIVGQLQLAFIKFHDRAVDLVLREKPNLAGAALFEETRRLVTWHYQWVVVHDFLPRIVGQPMVDALLKPDGTTDLAFYSFQNGPFMPVEFAAAAYRYGHSQVRPGYDLNENITDVPIFAPSDTAGQLEHLGGFRPIPQAWTIDWGHFVKIGGSRPQPSRKIDTRLARPLLRLPGGLDAAHNSLATLNLRRGKALQLPSGQAIAQAARARSLRPERRAAHSARAGHSALVLRAARGREGRRRAARPGRWTDRGRDADRPARGRPPLLPERPADLEARANPGSRRGQVHARGSAEVRDEVMRSRALRRREALTKAT